MMRIGCAWSMLVGSTSHAANCAQCARRAAFDREIATLANAAPVARTLDAERVLDQVLASNRQPVVSRWLRPLAIGGFSIAAAALGAVVMLAVHPAAAPAPLAVGALLPREVPTQIAHAVVTPLPDASVVRSDNTEIRLDHGSVFVDVDPGPHKPFRVRTPRFTVDVLGTAFSVREDGVVVERGTVRIATTSGELLASVAAGDVWSLPAPGGVLISPGPTFPRGVLGNPRR
jgi:ferric-dicitrate binding protein FerR (iron transport regulator)